MQKTANRDQPPLRLRHWPDCTAHTDGFGGHCFNLVDIGSGPTDDVGPYNGVVLTTKENPSSWTSVPAPDMPNANGLCPIP